MAPTVSPQLLVPSEPQNPLNQFTNLTHRFKRNPHFRPWDPLSAWLNYPKLQTPLLPSNGTFNTTLSNTTALHRRGETIKVDSHALHNSTIRAGVEAKDTSFAKRYGPIVGVVVGVAALVIMGFMLYEWRKAKIERRVRRRGVKFDTGKDGIVEQEGEGEAHEMGSVVNGVFTVGGGEGERDGEEQQRRSGELEDVPLN